MEYLEQILFDSDGTSLIADNSSNDYICSEEDIFTDNIEPIISNHVAAMCVKDLIPKGIGTASWLWNDDEVNIRQEN